MYQQGCKLIHFVCLWLVLPSVSAFTIASVLDTLHIQCTYTCTCTCTCTSVSQDVHVHVYPEIQKKHESTCTCIYSVHVDTEET